MFGGNIQTGGRNSESVSKGEADFASDCTSMVVLEVCDATNLLMLCIYSHSRLSCEKGKLLPISIPSGKE